MVNQEKSCYEKKNNIDRNDRDMNNDIFTYVAHQKRRFLEPATMWQSP